MNGQPTSRELIETRRDRRGAFTLIELLVVISVVVLLVAILLPVVHRVRKQAAAVACQSNLRQWGILVNTYVAGNDGKFFFRWTHVDNWDEPQPVTVWVQTWWYLFLTDFGNFRDIWLCPMATTPSADGQTGAVFRAWRAERPFERLREGGWGVQERELLGSYGVNGWVGISRRPDPNWPDAACWTTPYMKGAANVPLVFDCRGSINRGTLDGPPPYPDVDPSVHYSSNVCIDRHTGGINMTFMDWSVRKVGLKQLWGLKWHKQYSTTGPWTPAGGVRAEDWPEWMRRFEND